MSVFNNIIHSIVQDYADPSQEKEAKNSGLFLEKNRFRLNHLNQELSGKMETLMNHIEEAVKLKGVEKKKAFLQGPIKKELQELNKDIASRIQRKVKTVLLPPEKRKEQQALAKAKSMLEDLDRRLDSVYLEEVAVSIFKNHSPFRGKMQKIFEVFVPPFVEKLMNKVRFQLYRGWTEFSRQ